VNSDHAVDAWLSATGLDGDTAVRRHGIRRIRRVLTDNGSCYRSWAFAAALAGSKTRHKRTRPYRPQTNGKVERYHRTMATEWLYARPWTSNEQRRHALHAWLEHYSYHRPHSSLGGRPPISRATHPGDCCTDR
jgi:transposase InsO family protein